MACSSGHMRKPFDFVLLDHHKDCYLLDAQLLSRTGALANGAVLFADNVIFPGAPEYLKWVRSNDSPFGKSTFVPAEVEFTSKNGKWEVSTPICLLFFSFFHVSVTLDMSLDN